LERSGYAFTGGVSAAPAPRVFWGRSRGDRATFRLAIENAVLRFDLTVDGDTLSGTMVRSENGRNNYLPDPRGAAAVAGRRHKTRLTTLS